MYLLDTNICIEFLLRPTDRLLSRMAAAFGSMAVSTITVGELRVGSRNSTDRAEDEARLDRFLAGLDVRDFDFAAANEYGSLVRQKGIDRKSFDRLIAAHAMSLPSILVTNNERHFADVPGLKVENWTQ